MGFVLNTTTKDPATRVPPKQFQFRILDVVLLTTLLAVLLAGIVQGSWILLLAFAVGGLVCVFFVWKWHRTFPRGVEALVVAAILFLLIFALLPVIDTPRIATLRTTCQNNLKQIGLALHNYHDVNGSFPPAYIADEDGRPMHSWRVLLLPYLEHKPLYDQYRFDEPWDGPNNRLLAADIHRVYSCPADHADSAGKSTETSYVAVVGPGTAWPGEKAVNMGEIKDGTSNVLLIVEVHDSGIHWMEPRDLHVLQMASGINPPRGQGISSGHKQGAQVLRADGSVVFLHSDTPHDVLQSWLHIDDGTLASP